MWAGVGEKDRAWLTCPFAASLRTEKGVPLPLTGEQAVLGSGRLIRLRHREVRGLPQTDSSPRGRRCHMGCGVRAASAIF